MTPTIPLRIRLNVYAPSEFVIYEINGHSIVDVGRLIMTFNIIDVSDWRIALRICADLRLTTPDLLWCVEPASHIMHDLWRTP